METTDMAHYRNKKSTVNRVVRPQNWHTNPQWWDTLFHSRPRRRAESDLCREIIRGEDPDGIAWPVSDKPEHWYH